ncbi:MAG: hypothetical protein LBS29_01565 [Endomicrobium sp.]|jgi:hypothetical protein|uniref:hypothetical protein n=1 Tax=Candidatus Endomicrobiellum cubanum TaxID=3242325 RepID=UPI002823EF3C|nr:hypothetical protein [Endomicrobium sp.]MDR2395104.1 hypothetical protein [Endomicrobium sp.]
MKGNTLVILVAVIAALISAMYVSNKLQAKNERIFPQTFANIKASVVAPKLSRNNENENLAKKELKDPDTQTYFYTAKVRGIEYSIVYAKYPAQVNFDGAIAAIAKVFKNNNFQYTTTNNKVNDLDGVLLTGSFYKDEKLYKIKEQLVKDTNTFWQFIVIFLEAYNNETLAQNYIDSIKIIKE